MKVPCPVWLQGPWSPVGYQVVEIADRKVPATESESSPQASRPQQRQPWSAAGYQVVEVEEPKSSAPAPRSSADGRAPREAPRRKPHPLLRWGAVAAGASLLLGAVIVLLSRQPTQAQAAPPLAVPAPQGTGLFQALEGAILDDSKAPRETFGTSVQFVRNPAQAARIAGKERKLMLLLHVSGNFEESRFT
jgi:hypothetical protein